MPNKRGSLMTPLELSTRMGSNWSGQTSSRTWSTLPNGRPKGTLRSASRQKRRLRSWRTIDAMLMSRPPLVQHDVPHVDDHRRKTVQPQRIAYLEDVHH
eukprot:2096389-Amphidinium_carterae.1